ncbi:GPW/gp25 family protein [Paenibacillus sp. FSL R5-0527]|uniref:GPW/gp25 family protein n=1 Tax=Paenibacillus sp. FSL R5-0527 TaxID=2975321 RepID=UPI00097AA44D|nr:hypothetical protein BK140_11085 [Paenibacillus macerans]
MTTTYSVTADGSPEIKFGLIGVESVKQNIRTILTTIEGTCPLARGFGIDPAIIDSPTPAALALLEVNIRDAISQFEPRATVTEVDIHVDGDKLIPVVKFTLAEEANEFG